MRRILPADEAAAAFAADGTLIHANASAAVALGDTTALAALGIEHEAERAMASGEAGCIVAGRPAQLIRLGTGEEAFLLLAFAQPGEAPAAEPASPASADAAAPTVAAAPIEDGDVAAPTPSAPQEPSFTPAMRPFPQSSGPDEETRRHPLRFVWQMDATGRFSLGGGEFAEVIGPTVAATFGRPWTEIAAALELDPDGEVLRAVATHETWSGIALDWPVEGTNERLPVEMSGLPVFDRERRFRGYRGFGVCRDVERIAALSGQRFNREAVPSPVLPNPSRMNESENIVPFRSAAAETRPQPATPTLTAGERNAFREIGSRLTERLRGADAIASAQPAQQKRKKTNRSPPKSRLRTSTRACSRLRRSARKRACAVRSARRRTPRARAPAGRRAGLSSYPAFSTPIRLSWISPATARSPSFPEPAGSTCSSSKRTRKRPPATALPDKACASCIRAATTFRSRRACSRSPSTARLRWRSSFRLRARKRSPHLRQRRTKSARRRPGGRRSTCWPTASSSSTAPASSLSAMPAPRRCSALRHPHRQRKTCSTCWHPIPVRTARDCLDWLARPGAPKALSEGRDVVARRGDGRLVPLLMTIGRIGADDSGQFAVVLRDVSSWKKAQEDLLSAKRQAERVSAAKSEFLAKISHEIRTPLNAIIGFADLMMSERFGPVGNERYKTYLRDIHHSGEHLVSLVNDLIDLSKIEAGKLDLQPAPVDINELTSQSLALMQPQAARERIVIRMSLGTDLPKIIADARSVRQILLNLVSNAVRFAGAGGQVIVSTATTDDGRVALRIRDTGAGMTPEELARRRWSRSVRSRRPRARDRAAADWACR
ncbi:MAG: ATP-binding protein [Pseudorhodoplanes sp.]|nr:ATP-binding protein [Pseudorhodoplanes sp.]